MTISSATASASYTGNGTTAIFPVPFYFLVDTDLKVTRKTAAGDISVLTLNSDYTVSDAGNQQGGSITTIPAPATGDQIFIERNVDAVQETAYPENGYFPAASHEKALDRLTMLVQQLQTKDARTLTREPLSDAYDLADNRLVNVADAVEGTDAPNLAQTQALVAGAAGGLTPDDIALKSQLAAAATGAPSIGLLQQGIGAALRTVYDKAYFLLDMMDFVEEGTDADVLNGSVDAAPALSAAIDEALARGAFGVRLPPGKLRLNSTISKTVSGMNGLAIEGAGMGVTQLICYDASGSGLEFTAGASGNWFLNASPSNTFRFAHFSICSTGLNVGSGIKVSGGAVSGRPAAPCIFDHVETRQLDQLNTQAFAAGVRLIDTAGAQFNDCRFFAGGTTNQTSFGVRIEASGAGVDPTDHHFTGCKFFYGGAGVWAGNYVEGLAFANCIMLGLANGVTWNTTTGESGLFWSGGHINSNSYAFNLSNVFDVQITGGLFYAKSGLLLSTGSNLTVTGNTFYGVDASGTAIVLQGLTAGTRGSIISGNQFSSYTNGVTIDAASHGVTVGLNGFVNVATRVSNLSSDSYVAPRAYSTSTVKTLTGGATSETVDVSIPSGVFSAKPIDASLQLTDPMGADMIGFYVYNDAATTATNARFRVVRRDGANLPAGGYRFGLSAQGN